MAGRKIASDAIDPGNSGGTTPPPPSPAPRSTVDVKCAFCHKRFPTRAALDTHHREHEVPHPKLLIRGKEAADKVDLTQPSQLKALTVSDTAVVRIDQRPIHIAELGPRLKAANGGPCLLLELIGRREVRARHHIRVRLFSRDVLQRIDNCYFKSLNVRGITAPDVTSFLERWRNRPESVYAQAIADFRWAIAMTDRSFAVNDSARMPAGLLVAPVHLLAKCRDEVLCVNRPLGRAMLASMDLFDNRFTPGTPVTGEAWVDYSLSFFASLTNEGFSSAPFAAQIPFRLMLDEHHAELLDALELHAKGRTDEAVAKASALYHKTLTTYDESCKRKVAALLIHWQAVPDGKELLELLKDDPVFEQLCRKRTECL